MKTNRVKLTAAAELGFTKDSQPAQLEITDQFDSGEDSYIKVKGTEEDKSEFSFVDSEGSFVALQKKFPEAIKVDNSGFSSMSKGYLVWKRKGQWLAAKAEVA